ncbi:DUF2207 domain-containing protein [Lactobacillus sp. ESL0703]|uniref:DUF2207 domain-containing protein n=1 Tax=Lactobacillus sp. ESL0703 TaxID=2983218 RepID=UPI0023F7C1E9|nr:DUF2207 domain-containing protein [Lactobacillus sp. ESL0703]MDF7668132.1 DUF2207 domain-containing protein [Lactobacillus sp. ESL0703]
MKHKLLKLLLLVELVILGVTLNQQVKAEEAYDITKVVATAWVKSDGSLIMKRQITYDFNDDVHGVYYQQNLAKHQEIKDLHIAVQDNNEEPQAATNYSVKQTAEGDRFKVYHPVSEDSRLTVTYDYRITNAITNYQDTAELNFMIIGNNWNTDLDHVTASVIFPGPVKQLKAWAHGSLNGAIRVLPNQGKIIMTADNLNGKTGIEVHTIFPVSVTAANKNIVRHKHRQAVLRQEAKLANEANQKRLRGRIINWILIVLGLISGLAAIIKGFSVKKQGVTPEKDVGFNS